MERLFLVNVQTNVSFAVLILFVTSLKCCYFLKVLLLLCVIGKK